MSPPGPSQTTTFAAEVGAAGDFGLNIGKIVHWYEQLTGQRLINAQTYFIDYLPSDVRLSDVLIIAAISLLMAFLATLYPSWAAARTQPAEALRYE